MPNFYSLTRMHGAHTNSRTLHQNVRSLERGDGVGGSAEDILGTTNTEIISDENNMLLSHVNRCHRATSV